METCLSRTTNNDQRSLPHLRLSIPGCRFFPKILTLPYRFPALFFLLLIGKNGNYMRLFSREKKMKKILLILALFSSSLVVWAQAKRVVEPANTVPYPTGLFRSVDGTSFDLEQEYANAGLNGQLNILNWLQGRVAGLQVYTYYGTAIPFIRNYPAAIYVDEVRTDATFLGMLPVEDIALVKVIKNASILSTRGGAIAIYTKRGEAEEEESEQ